MQNKHNESNHPRRLSNYPAEMWCKPYTHMGAKKTHNKELLFSFNADDKLPKPTTIMDDDDRRTVAWLARQICRNGLAH